MLDIGFWELLVVALVTLLVVGPERLPGVARNAGMWARRIRRAVYTLRTQFERELDAEELRRPLYDPGAAQRPPETTPDAAEGRPGEAAPPERPTPDDHGR